MTTRQFLQTTAAAFLLFVTSVLFSPNAQAHCDCINSVNVDHSVQCCILKSSISVSCGDGSTNPAFPSAGPDEAICPGFGSSFPCPCPTSNILALIIDGHAIPPGSSLSFIYSVSNCCLHVSVTSPSSGCLTVTITPGSCSCDCQNQISIAASVECCINKSDIQVNCNDGSTDPAYPGAGPGEQICPDHAASFLCPCTSGMASISIGGSVCPIGYVTNIPYGGCCMAVTVIQGTDGCIAIHIDPCPSLTTAPTRPASPEMKGAASARTASRYGVVTAQPSRHSQVPPQPRQSDTATVR